MISFWFTSQKAYHNAPSRPLGTPLPAKIQNNLLETSCPLVELYERKPRRTPAATAEPMTPATFGPIACISR